MIDLKELNKLLDKATPGEWMPELHLGKQAIFSGGRWVIYDMPSGANVSLVCSLHNNAKELLRLAEIGERAEEIATTDPTGTYRMHFTRTKNE